MDPGANNKQVIPQSQHKIPTKDISQAAAKVIDQLQASGYAAYIVGGGVRDLLLNNHPKDFDVATDATPEEVRSIFRSSRIIGKRFRIVHVRFGREMIEVTTFRGHHAESNSEGEASQSDQGVILRDNVYGDIESDAIRRDLTVNALYYDPNKGHILDFTGGMKDLADRTIRVIGEPEVRYKEDPVRMLRAVRFAAKLGFHIHPDTDAPIHAHADYLAHIPAARLFEEVLKLFMSGQGTATLTQLRDHNLFEFLFPGTEERLKTNNKFDIEFVTHAIINTDKRIRQGKRVTPAFIYAAFLWLPLNAVMRELTVEHKLSPYDAMQRAAQGVISQQLACTSIPKRFLVAMREIWSLQLRLPKRDGKKAYAVLEHPRFRAAYDFLLLREQAGEKMDGLGLWWTKFQSADAESRETMLSDLKTGKKGQKKPRKRRPPKQKTPTETP